MLDTRFDRPPGDIGCPDTYDGPVLFQRVDGATPERVVRKDARGLLDAFVEGARALEGRGARAITTSCGFLALHHQTLASVVNVPMLTSSLLLTPRLLASLPRSGRLGVVTFSAASLRPDHFAGVGVTSMDRIDLIGLEEAPTFHRPIAENRPGLDVETARVEVVDVVSRYTSAHPEIAALLLECTNLPPYAADIGAACGLPVWDILSLLRSVVGTALIAVPAYTP